MFHRGVGNIQLQLAVGGDGHCTYRCAIRKVTFAVIVNLLLAVVIYLAAFFVLLVIGELFMAHDLPELVAWYLPTTTSAKESPPTGPTPPPSTRRYRTT